MSISLSSLNPFGVISPMIPANCTILGCLERSVSFLFMNHVVSVSNTRIFMESLFDELYCFSVSGIGENSRWKTLNHAVLFLYINHIQLILLYYFSISAL